MTDDGLTAEAKAELHAAIAIIREDRFGKYARTVLKTASPRDTPEPPKPAGPPEPPKPADPPKPVDPPAPPPVKPVDPPPPVVKRVSRWWGEIDD